MNTENRFNLIDEPWIPIVDVGRVSLKQVFSEPAYKALGGNPVQKIALTKLLLAVAQAAYTPVDDEDWKNLGAEDMARRCLEYLSKWHDRFWLYGEKPFLQVRELKHYKTPPIGALIPYIAVGNKTVLYQTQIDSTINDAEWALILLTDQNFSLKHNFAYAAATPTYSKGKGKATRPGPALGTVGYLHNFLQGNNLIQTIWFNQLSQEVINLFPFKYNLNQSKPVWEITVTNRDSQEASVLKDSYIGRLCPLSRFVIQDNRNSIKYCEGIIYPTHLDEGMEVSVAFNNSKNTSLNVNPSKRPWRDLAALLSFVHNETSSTWECLQLKYSFHNARLRDVTDSFSIWSGGVALRGDGKSQFAKGEDDYVESIIDLKNSFFEDPRGWFQNMQEAMKLLEDFESEIKDSVYNFYKKMKDSKKRDKQADAIASQASNLYWQLCERKFQDLVDVCVDYKKAHAMRKIFAGYAHKAYDTFCPKETARQLDAWAKCRPNLVKYLKEVD